MSAMRPDHKSATAAASTSVPAPSPAPASTATAAETTPSGAAAATAVGEGKAQPVVTVDELKKKVSEEIDKYVKAGEKDLQRVTTSQMSVHAYYEHERHKKQLIEKMLADPVPIMLSTQNRAFKAFVDLNEHRQSNYQNDLAALAHFNQCARYVGRQFEYYLALHGYLTFRNLESYLATFDQKANPSDEIRGKVLSESSQIQAWEAKISEAQWYLDEIVRVAEAKWPDKSTVQAVASGLEASWADYKEQIRKHQQNLIQAKDALVVQMRDHQSSDFKSYSQLLQIKTELEEKLATARTSLYDKRMSLFKKHFTSKHPNPDIVIDSKQYGKDEPEFALLQSKFAIVESLQNILKGLKIPAKEIGKPQVLRAGINDLIKFFHKHKAALLKDAGLLGDGGSKLVAAIEAVEKNMAAFHLLDEKQAEEKKAEAKAVEPKASKIDAKAAEAKTRREPKINAAAIAHALKNDDDILRLEAKMPAAFAQLKTCADIMKTRYLYEPYYDHDPIKKYEDWLRIYSYYDPSYVQQVRQFKTLIDDKAIQAVDQGVFPSTSEMQKYIYGLNSFARSLDDRKRDRYNEPPASDQEEFSQTLDAYTKAIAEIEAGLLELTTKVTGSTNAQFESEINRTKDAIEKQVSECAKNGESTQCLKFLFALRDGYQKRQNEVDAKLRDWKVEKQRDLVYVYPYKPTDHAFAHHVIRFVDQRLGKTYEPLLQHLDQTIAEVRQAQLDALGKQNKQLLEAKLPGPYAKLMKARADIKLELMKYKIKLQDEIVGIISAKRKPADDKAKAAIKDEVLAALINLADCENEREVSNVKDWPSKDNDPNYYKIKRCYAKCRVIDACLQQLDIPIPVEHLGSVEHAAMPLMHLEFLLQDPLQINYQIHKSPWSHAYVAKVMGEDLRVLSDEAAGPKTFRDVLLARDTPTFTENMFSLSSVTAPLYGSIKKHLDEVRNLFPSASAQPKPGD